MSSRHRSHVGAMSSFFSCRCPAATRRRRSSTRWHAKAILREPHRDSHDRNRTRHVAITSSRCRLRSPAHVNQQFPQLTETFGRARTSSAFRIHCWPTFLISIAARISPAGRRLRSTNRKNIVVLSIGDACRELYVPRASAESFYPLPVGAHVPIHGWYSETR